MCPTIDSATISGHAFFRHAIKVTIRKIVDLDQVLIIFWFVSSFSFTQKPGINKCLLKDLTQLFLLFFVFTINLLAFSCPVCIREWVFPRCEVSSSCHLFLRLTCGWSWFIVVLYAWSGAATALLFSKMDDHDPLPTWPMHALQFRSTIHSLRASTAHCFPLPHLGSTSGRPAISALGLSSIYV